MAAKVSSQEEVDSTLLSDIEERIGVEWQDQGIGRYEYAGAVGTHTDWQVEITSLKVTVRVRGDIYPPQVPLAFASYFEVDGGSGVDVYYKATIGDAGYDGVSDTYHITYDIEQIDAVQYREITP